MREQKKNSCFLRGKQKDVQKRLEGLVKTL